MALLKNAVKLFDANQITDTVWCGATLDRDSISMLEKMGIRRVVNLETEARYDSRLLAVAGIDFIQVSVIDMDVPLPEKLIDDAVAAIDEASSRGLKVYVHCTAGWQRSPAIVACYLIYKGMSAEQALTRVKRARPVARFYSSHIASAMRYEKRLRRKLALRIRN